MKPDDSHLREERISRHEAFRGRLLHVFEDTVRLPSGAEASREVVEHIGAVTVVATDDADRVVLVRQWRHAAGRALWELPAGTREAYEDPAATARRELTEETGYAASTWRELGKGFVSPGYSSEEIWFFHASGLTAGDTSPDADELLDVELFDAAGLRGLARSGEIDLKTLAGLALAGRGLAAADG